MQGCLTTVATTPLPGVDEWSVIWDVGGAGVATTRGKGLRVAIDGVEAKGWVDGIDGRAVKVRARGLTKVTAGSAYSGAAFPVPPCYARRHAMLLLLAAPALADEPAPPRPRVVLGGELHASYGLSLNDGFHNAFALDRARLTVTAPLTQRLAVYAAVDADRLAWTEGEPPDTKLRVLVRNAWLELHAVPVGMRFRAGMVDTPFTSYSEHIVDTRFLTPSFGEEIGWLHPADLGVSFYGRTANGLLEWDSAIVNGEGFDNIELDAGKTGQARVTVDPWGVAHAVKIPLTFFGSYDSGADVGIYGAGLGYQSKWGTAWYEFFGRVEGGTHQLAYCGTDLFGRPNIGYLVLRYGHVYLDLRDPEAVENTLIAGVLRGFGPVRVSATWEATWRGVDLVDPTHGIFLRTDTGF